MTTYLKHGRDHMARIGRRGFDALVNRHFMGDAAEATAWLRRRAGEKQIGRLVEAKLDARIAAGEKCACEELPILMEPDSDPLFHEPTPRWTARVAASRAADAEIDLPF